MVGIDAKNKHTLDNTYICSVCSLILLEPVQLINCGHRQCQSCLDTQHETSITCRQCQLKTSRNEILRDRGFKTDMTSLFIECSFCQWTGVLNNYPEHLDESHSNLKCEYCDEEFNSIHRFNEHQVFVCQKRTVDCKLKDFGCDEKIGHDKMHEHYLTEHHQRVTVNVIRQMISKLNDSQIDNSFSQVTTLRDCTRVKAQLKELYEIANSLSDAIQTLNNDQQYLSTESLRSQVTLPTLMEELSKVKLSVEEANTFLEGMRYNQEVLSQDFASLQEKVNDLQYVSYDGTFLWKIIDVKKKMIDAQSERQTSIYSPPFYSSPTGYKMRARLYLNGDGNARRTHLSLFFVLMRSVNDPILIFPFSYKVTFCLYDQTPAQRHIIDSFRPDIKSNSFQRPRSDMNIASGIPKFFPLEMIQKEENPYVRDDTMFIKIMVDFEGMQKTLLPYALTLNQGLPSHVQQAMIKQEVERRYQEKPPE
ncbi:unnamed protein product [Rotaria magnacalcarata]|uniref:RING-type domain-containing protein n=2 Tax=Rotaria magnacalcarata TaxID=392030 RepID=A0A815M4D7_9BILA|nr:unnamed protein product [Rotaria magnacalcarata]CAF2046716.1 unnamed protein product [Rotaria magnacalcarata]